MEDVNNKYELKILRMNEILAHYIEWFLNPLIASQFRVN